jgi:hypothetical protein
VARFNNGWIKVYRKLLDSDIAVNPIRFSLFVRLMGMANLEGTWVQWGAQPRLCPRGSLVTSIRELADKIGADKGSVERQIKYLALRDTIVVETETRGTFITIKNFELYQDNIILTGTDEGHRTDDDADTVADILADKVADSNEELITKELKKKEINARILKIYELHYPKKAGKTKGIAAAVKLFKTEAEVDHFEKAVIRYKASLIKNKTEAQYIKHFSTFVTSWDDWSDEKAGTVDIDTNKKHANERETDHDAEIDNLFKEQGA